MTWPRLLYDQTNLVERCADRVIHATEYHIQNQLYGFATLLQEYAGLPPDEPLPWAMEHFISFDNPQPYAPDLQTRLPIILAVSEGQAEVLRRHVSARVEPIGSAFFYLRELYRRRHADDDDATERRGTIVFPDKSTVDLDTDYDRERFARDLAALPASFQPVYVSIFWRDYVRGTHLPFAEAGLQLVSSGHPYDPEFLFRQYNLCRQFKYACANDLSTSFCMSVLAGCQFIHWPTGPLQFTSGGQTCRYEQEPTLLLPGKQDCISACRFPPRGNLCEQLALAWRYAGKSSVRSPEFLQDLFHEGGRRLQEQPPRAVAFATLPARDQLAPWLASGIDSDGWAQRCCGFRLRGQAGQVGVRMTIEVADPIADLHKGTLCVNFNGENLRNYRLSPGRFQLRLALRPEERNVTLILTCDNETHLEGGARRRAFRLLELGWFDRGRPGFHRC